MNANATYQMSEGEISEAWIVSGNVRGDSDLAMIVNENERHGKGKVGHDGIGCNYSTSRLMGMYILPDRMVIGMIYICDSGNIVPQLTTSKRLCSGHDQPLYRAFSTKITHRPYCPSDGRTNQRPYPSPRVLCVVFTYNLI